MSKITNNNFDLKLQVWHRDQKIQSLSNKLQNLQGVEEELELVKNDNRTISQENEELKRSNAALVNEMKYRDQAAEEAAREICELESLINELRPGGTPPFPSTPETSEKENSSGINEMSVTPSSHELTIDVPKRTSSKRATTPRSSRNLSSKSAQPRKTSTSREDSSSKDILTPKNHYYSNETSNSPSSSSCLTKSESFSSNMAAESESISSGLSALSECSELTQRNESETPVTGQQSLGSYASRSREPESNEDDESPERAAAPRTIKIPRHRPHQNSLQLQGDIRLPPTPDTMSPVHRTPEGSRSNSTAVAASKGGDIIGDNTPSKKKQLRQRYSTTSMPRPTSVENMTNNNNNNNVTYPFTIDIGIRPSTAAGFHNGDNEQQLGIDVPQRPSTASTVTSSFHGLRYPRSTVSSHSLRQHTDFSLNEQNEDDFWIPYNTNIGRGIRPSTSPAFGRGRRHYGSNAGTGADTSSSQTQAQSLALDTEDWLEAARMGPLSPISPLTPGYKNTANSNGNMMGAPYTDPQHLKYHPKQQQQQQPRKFSLLGHSGGGGQRNRFSMTSPLNLKGGGGLGSDNNNNNNINNPSTPNHHNNHNTQPTDSEGRKRRWLGSLLRFSRQSSQPFSSSKGKSAFTSAEYDDDGSDGAPAPVVHKSGHPRYSYI